AAEAKPIHIEGKPQLVGFAAIICAVALAPSVNLDAIQNGDALWHHWLPVRELIMLTAAALSYLLGDKALRFERNGFKWAPIQEVAALFIGIFLTMIPALLLLRRVAPSLPLDALTLFAFTGGLSAFLDNAPTYVTFFEMARELAFDGARVAGVPVPYLVAISLGAVFGGALTYIGNGPNFMVKVIAENAQVPMPSFGGYILRWSALFYLPVLVALAFVFIAQAPWLKAIGALLTLTIAACSLWVGMKYSRASAPHQDDPAPDDGNADGDGEREG
ncbi:MAG: sodium:proton antiporter, partial [Myxococcales bacterium]|nr:sodium:proton antiporter [Myxococcales bacterium]